MTALDPFTTRNPVRSRDRLRPSRMRSEHGLALAGLAAIAVSYGFARYGPGLFSADIRREFGLSLSMFGLVTSSSYVGYLIALVSAGLLTQRLGPRVMILTSGVSATGGLAILTFATTTPMLTAGILLAGMSGGWSWAPYSDAVDMVVPRRRRRRVLGLIASGTAFGILVAGPLALLTAGSAWRVAWIIFTAVALVVTGINAWVLPRGRRSVTPVGGRGARWFLRRQAVPLYLTAGSYGLTSAIYWSFAIQLIDGATAAGNWLMPAFWTVLGASGTLAVFTGGVVLRLGLPRTHRLLLLALVLGTAMLGLAPGIPWVVVLAALVYGATYMAMSGHLAMWSHQVFADRPSAGFSVTVFFLGIGSIVGPAIAGMFAQRYGLPLVFLVTAGLIAITVLAGPGDGKRDPAWHRWRIWVR